VVVQQEPFGQSSRVLDARLPARTIFTTSTVHRSIVDRAWVWLASVGVCQGKNTEENREVEDASLRKLHVSSLIGFSLWGPSYDS
jgi:hypothetical protein